MKNMIPKPLGMNRKTDHIMISIQRSMIFTNISNSIRFSVFTNKSQITNRMTQKLNRLERCIFQIFEYYLSQLAPDLY